MKDVTLVRVFFFPTFYSLGSCSTKRRLTVNLPHGRISLFTYSYDKFSKDVLTEPLSHCFGQLCPETDP